jgi:hypothetical protein
MHATTDVSIVMLDQIVRENSSIFKHQCASNLIMQVATGVSSLMLDQIPDECSSIFNHQLRYNMDTGTGMNFLSKFHVIPAGKPAIYRYRYDILTKFLGLSAVFAI